eukprot:Rmarinus@m.1186
MSYCRSSTAVALCLVISSVYALLFVGASAQAYRNQFDKPSSSYPTCIFLTLLGICCLVRAIVFGIKPFYWLCDCDDDDDDDFDEEECDEDYPNLWKYTLETLPFCMYLLSFLVLLYHWASIHYFAAFQTRPPRTVHITVVGVIAVVAVTQATEWVCYAIFVDDRRSVVIAASIIFAVLSTGLSVVFIVVGFSLRSRLKRMVVVSDSAAMHRQNRLKKVHTVTIAVAISFILRAFLLTASPSSTDGHASLTDSGSIGRDIYYYPLIELLPTILVIQACGPCNVGEENNGSSEYLPPVATKSKWKWWTWFSSGHDEHTEPFLSDGSFPPSSSDGTSVYSSRSHSYSIDEATYTGADLILGYGEVRPPQRPEGHVRSPMHPSHTHSQTHAHAYAHTHAHAHAHAHSTHVPAHQPLVGNQHHALRSPVAT